MTLKSIRLGDERVYTVLFHLYQTLEKNSSTVRESGFVTAGAREERYRWGLPGKKSREPF